MSRGRRYSNEPKLNVKKVIAVVIAIIVIIMFVIALKNLLSSDSSSKNLVSTAYFLVNKNNKWGVIDNSSKIVIEPTYTESIIIPNNKKDIFICTYNVEEDGTYKTRVLNSKNKELFTNYDQIYGLENYDENNNLWYENNVLKVEKDGKYGLIDFNGKEILNCSYDDIYTLKGTENSIITVKDEKKGLVNDGGKELVKTAYEDIISLGKDTKMYIVKENGKFGIENILECKYDDIKPLNNKDIFYVEEDGQYKIINKDEESIFSEDFDSIKTIKDNIVVYSFENNYYAYNISENKKLSDKYEELTYTANGLFIAKKNDDYGIINIDDEEKISADYTNINYYENVEMYELEKQGETENTILDRNLNEILKGIISTTNKEKGYITVWKEEGYKYYDLKGEEKEPSQVLVQNNLFLSKKDNKFGFVDKNGNIVVDYIYDDAREQNDYGYAAIKQNGLWGAIDKNGQIICETKYNLDNNLIIDFIGEYHLGVDINSMYYTNK